MSVRMRASASVRARVGGISRQGDTEIEAQTESA